MSKGMHKCLIVDLFNRLIGYCFKNELLLRYGSS